MYLNKCISMYQRLEAFLKINVNKSRNMINSIEKQNQHIIVSNIEKPILRAGLSNIIFLLLIIFLISVNQILNEFFVNILLKSIIFLMIFIVTLKMYSHSISKIFVNNLGKLIVIGPISKTTIEISEIEKVEISGIPSSMIIFILLKMKNATLPKCFFIIALSTNCGSYSDTKAKLIELLGTRTETYVSGHHT